MKPLRESMVRVARQTRVVYSVQAPAGSSVEDIVKPEFWINIAPKLRPCDQLEVIPEDMAYFARLMVVDVNSLGVYVKVLDFVEIDTNVPSEAELSYEVKWAGPVDKFRVMRTSNNEVIERGFATKAEAHNYIKNIAPRQLAA